MHDGVDDMAQLPCYGGDRYSITFALGALLFIEGPQARVMLPGLVGREPKRTSEIGDHAW